MVIREAYEHTDDEIVTFDKIDLNYEFDKLNDLLFGGTLERVPIAWSTTKGRHGHVSYRRWYDSTVEKINGLFLSKFFKIPYKMFKDTLAHEMIHVKNLQDDIKTKRKHYKSEAHGFDFIKEMNRINSMGLGFKVSVKGEESYDVADDIKGRNVYGAIIKLDGFSKSGEFVAVMVPKAYASRKETLERIFNNLITSGKYKSVEIEYFQSNNPYFLRFPVQRNFDRKVGYIKVKPEEMSKIRELATFIDKVDLGSNTASAQKDKEREEREKRGFYSGAGTLTKVDPPSFKPKEEPKKEEPQTSEKTKEQNKQIMTLFKASTDQKQKESLFDILKMKDEFRRDQMIKMYNIRFGKFGIIK